MKIVWALLHPLVHFHHWMPQRGKIFLPGFVKVGQFNVKQRVFSFKFICILGLEKMEREKQKKEEREKFLQDREIQRQKEIELSNQLSQDPNVVLRSRFDDSEDGDSEEQDDETETAPALAAPKTRETLQDVVGQIIGSILLRS